MSFREVFYGAVEQLAVGRNSLPALHELFLNALPIGLALQCAKSTHNVITLY